MQKQKQQDEEISLTNAYSLFVYAIRTQITRDYYLRRLRIAFTKELKIIYGSRGTSPLSLLTVEINSNIKL